ncbi:MAG: cytochrome c3 family protein [Myxococcaceae bacterium]|nr:cytochrome c3 family protein [Myxococcaceae bacterium]
MARLFSSAGARRWTRRISGTTAVLSLVAGIGLAVAATGRERSLAVYPPQAIPLKFDHWLHIDDVGADCTACHFEATRSARSSDNLLPSKAHPNECDDCHETAKAEKGEKTDPPADCEVCHVGFDRTVQKQPAKVQVPSPNLIFDHAVHVKKQKIECEVCHGKFEGVAVATRQQLPKMATCLNCHDGKRADASCRTCHPTQPSGRLQLTFVSGMLRPMQGNPLGMDHGPRFEFNHGTQANARRSMCMECHAQKECNACHDALQKPLSVHPNDFITLHPIQARQDTTRCQSCHRLQSFCVACHERVGVGLSADPALRPANVRVHPPYQVWVEIIGPQHHGIAANRDLKSCVSCHREEDCLSCHSDADTFGTRRQVNPHPPGFAARCKSLAAKNDRPCLVCHRESALVAKGCR